MNALKKLNEIYGKYLFAVIPAVTLILAICEVLYEISHGDVMHIVAYILMGFVSISFCGFYLRIHRTSLTKQACVRSLKSA